MLVFDPATHVLTGDAGSLQVPHDDEVTHKLLMLIEGQCYGRSPSKVAARYGFSKQRYYQLLHRFTELGTRGLASAKRGPKTNYRRTEQLERQVIRHRFLDPDASAEVIAQKLRQSGNKISTRSVLRIIEQYGLQKKTPCVSP